MSYPGLLARHPYVIIGIVIVLVFIEAIVIGLVGTVPDFSDPKAGFETRGTEISERYISWRHLVDATGSQLRVAPPHDSIPTEKNLPTNNKPGHRVNVDDANDTSYLVRPLQCPKSPGPQYARLVFQSVTGANLFTAASIHSVCSVERTLFSDQEVYTGQCEGLGDSCCPSWSLGRYIALLTGKDSCFDVTPNDTRHVLNLLRDCAQYYHRYQLGPECGSEDKGRASPCRKVPAHCTKHDAVYNILHYMVDKNFITNTSYTRNAVHLRFAATFLPLAASSSSLPVYMDMSRRDWSDGQTEIVAAKFGIKYKLFDIYLQNDTIWIIAAVAAVYLVTWLYTSSLFLTLMTIASLLMTLATTYLLYTFIFSIDFFPFLNLLTFVIILGIGADDMFIYCHTWNLTKSERNNGTLKRLVSNTLRDATSSMFVTSLTTAAAFYASNVSHITAVRCFAIFSGTAVIVNFFFNLTWIPACVLMYDKWCSNYCVCYNPEFYTSHQKIWLLLCRGLYDLYRSVSSALRNIFEKHLPIVIQRIRFLWILLLTGLSIGGAVLVFLSPRLRLPSTDYFQLFPSDHPIEVYDRVMTKQFGFEVGSTNSRPTMPMTFVWGVDPDSSGDAMNPYNRGKLQLRDFNVTSPESQVWLLNFCANLRNQTFYQPMWGFHLADCFIENFKTDMESPCVQVTETDPDKRPCCEQSSFPYPDHLFKQCVVGYLHDVIVDPMYLHQYSGAVPGLRFSPDGAIVGLIVEFDSNVPFAYTYTKMSEFHSTVSAWFAGQMKTAPEGMKEGWFISASLLFYDLQDAIATGTYLSLVLAATISAGVLFIMTLNALLSIYAVVSIALAVLVTLGALVLMDWELNVLESLTISIAVGLTVDFVLHYGVAYRLTPELDRSERVHCSLTRMGSPVTMAALTSFLAGALMMPSSLVVYRNLGTFLMLIMSCSWVYGTFYFLTILHVIGPQGEFAQFHWPRFHCCTASPHRRVDKTVYCMSESTASTSSGSYPPHQASSSSDAEPRGSPDFKANNNMVPMDFIVPKDRTIRFSDEAHTLLNHKEIVHLREAVV